MSNYLSHDFNFGLMIPTVDLTWSDQYVLLWQRMNQSIIQAFNDVCRELDVIGYE